MPRLLPPIAQTNSLERTLLTECQNHNKGHWYQGDFTTSEWRNFEYFHPRLLKKFGIYFFTDIFLTIGADLLVSFIDGVIGGGIEAGTTKVVMMACADGVRIPCKIIIKSAFKAEKRHKKLTGLRKDAVTVLPESFDDADDSSDSELIIEIIPLEDNRSQQTSSDPKTILQQTPPDHPETVLQQTPSDYEIIDVFKSIHFSPSEFLLNFWPGYHRSHALSRLNQDEFEALQRFKETLFFKPPKSGRQLNTLCIPYPKIDTGTALPSNLDSVNPPLFSKVWDGYWMWPLLDYVFFNTVFFENVSYLESPHEQLLEHHRRRFLNTLPHDQKILSKAMRFYYLGRNFFLDSVFEDILPKIELGIESCLSSAFFSLDTDLIYLKSKLNEKSKSFTPQISSHIIKARAEPASTDLDYESGMKDLTSKLEELNKAKKIAEFNGVWSDAVTITTLSNKLALLLEKLRGNVNNEGTPQRINFKSVSTVLGGLRKIGTEWTPESFLGSAGMAAAETCITTILGEIEIKTSKSNQLKQRIIDNILQTITLKSGTVKSAIKIAGGIRTIYGTADFFAKIILKSISSSHKGIIDVITKEIGTTPAVKPDIFIHGPSPIALLGFAGCGVIIDEIRKNLYTHMDNRVLKQVDESLDEHGNIKPDMIITDEIFRDFGRVMRHLLADSTPPDVIHKKLQNLHNQYRNAASIKQAVSTIIIKLSKQQSHLQQMSLAGIANFSPIPLSTQIPKSAVMSVVNPYSYFTSRTKSPAEGRTRFQRIKDFIKRKEDALEYTYSPKLNDFIAYLQTGNITSSDPLIRIEFGQIFNALIEQIESDYIEVFSDLAQLSTAVYYAKIYQSFLLKKRKHFLENLSVYMINAIPKTEMVANNFTGTQIKFLYLELLKEKACMGEPYNPEDRMLFEHLTNTDSLQAENSYIRKLIQNLNDEYFNDSRNMREAGSPSRYTTRRPPPLTNPEELSSESGFFQTPLESAPPRFGTPLLSEPPDIFYTPLSPVSPLQTPRGSEPPNEFYPSSDTEPQTFAITSNNQTTVFTRIHVLPNGDCLFYSIIESILNLNNPNSKKQYLNNILQSNPQWILQTQATGAPLGDAEIVRYFETSDRSVIVQGMRNQVKSYIREFVNIQKQFRGRIGEDPLFTNIRALYDINFRGRVPQFIDDRRNSAGYSRLDHDISAISNMGYWGNREGDISEFITPLMARLYRIDIRAFSIAREIEETRSVPKRYEYTISYQFYTPPTDQPQPIVYIYQNRNRTHYNGLKAVILSLV